MLEKEKRDWIPLGPSWQSIKLRLSDLKFCHHGKGLMDDAITGLCIIFTCDTKCNDIHCSIPRQHSPS